MGRVISKTAQLGSTCVLYRAPANLKVCTTKKTCESHRLCLVVKLRDVMGKWLGESGKTPNSPLYVTTLSSRSQYLYYLISFGIGLLLVFAIISPSGLSGRLFSPLHKEHSTLTRKEQLSDVIGR